MLQSNTVKYDTTLYFYNKIILRSLWPVFFIVGLLNHWFSGGGAALAEHSKVPFLGNLAFFCKTDLNDVFFGPCLSPCHQREAYTVYKPGASASIEADVSELSSHSPLIVFIIQISLNVTIDFTVSRIGTVSPLLLLGDLFSPIRDTIQQS